MKHIFNKYKVLLLSLLLVATLVGGTYAYLVATDSEVVNTFKLARVDTDITEATEDDTNDNTANKEVKIQNKDISSVYVRARVVISGADAAVSDIDYVKASEESSTVTPAEGIRVVYNDSNWEKVADGANCWFYYKGILHGKEEDGTIHKTEALITKVLVGSNVDKEKTFDVDIYQESVLTSKTDYVQSQAEAAFNKR